MEQENKLSRTKMHENAMICLYQYLFYQKVNRIYRKSINEIVLDVTNISFDDCDDFFKCILFEAYQDKKQLIEIISNCLEKSWKFNRLALIAQAILLLFSEEIINHRVEVNVAIDVAVDLAKRYLDDGDYKFIHAVLNRIGKEYAK